MGLLAFLISMMEFGKMIVQKILIQKLQSAVMGFCFAQLTDHKLLRTPEGGAPGTAHEGRGESRELNDTITEWKRVPHIHVVRRVNEII